MTSRRVEQTNRELSGAGLLSDLYWDFGLQRNLVHLSNSKHKDDFSATGSV
jgi:hypothetical protein